MVAQSCGRSRRGEGEIVTASRLPLAIALALIVGWFIRILAEMDLSTVDPFISMISFAALLLLVWFARGGERE